MTWHHRCRREGLLQGLWRGVTLKSVLILCEAANWIRLLPSMLMFGQHTRASAFSILLTVLLGNRPTPMSRITVWFHALLCICILDWLINEFPRVKRVWARGQKQRIAVLRYLLAETMYALLLAPGIALTVCLTMIVFVQGIASVFG